MQKNDHTNYTESSDLIRYLPEISYRRICTDVANWILRLSAVSQITFWWRDERSTSRSCGEASRQQLRRNLARSRARASVMAPPLWTSLPRRGRAVAAARGRSDGQHNCLQRTNHAVSQPTPSIFLTPPRRSSRCGRNKSNSLRANEGKM